MKIGGSGDGLGIIWGPQTKARTIPDSSRRDLLIPNGGHVFSPEKVTTMALNEVILKNLVPGIQAVYTTNRVIIYYQSNPLQEPEKSLEMILCFQ